MTTRTVRTVASAAVVTRRLTLQLVRRRAERLAAAERAGRRVSAAYSALADILAGWAGEVGFVGLVGGLQRIAAAVHEAHRLVGQELARAGLAAYRGTADAIGNTVPAEWLRLAAGPQRVREAEEDFSLSDAVPVFSPPTPEEVLQWLKEAPPGGLDWDARLRKWEEPIRAAFLSELTIGLSAGENVDELRARLQPYADNLAWKAQRIARTEANRAAERASRKCFEEIGGVLDGLQIVAVLDEWTRPDHRARNGRLYVRGPDGVYRDASGREIPDLPDAPNCRCMSVPVLTGQLDQIVEKSKEILKHFQLPEEELRRQRQWNLAVHSPDENRREILRRAEVWDKLEKNAPKADFPGFHEPLQKYATQRLEEIFDRLREQRREQCRAAVYLPQRHQAQIELVGKIPGGLKLEADAASRFLCRLVHRKHVASLEIPVKIHDGLLSGTGIHLPGAVSVHPEARRHTFVHELAHELSRVLPEFGREALGWRERVTEGGELRTGRTADALGKVWVYRTRTDGVEQLSDLDKYLTRVYETTETRMPERHEVISVGLQKLYLEPDRLGRQDPSLLELLLKGIQ